MPLHCSLIALWYTIACRKGTGHTPQHSWKLAALDITAFRFALLGLGFWTLPLGDTHTQLSFVVLKFCQTIVC